MGDLGDPDRPGRPADPGVLGRHRTATADPTRGVRATRRGPRLAHPRGQRPWRRAGDGQPPHRPRAAGPVAAGGRCTSPEHPAQRSRHTRRGAPSHAGTRRPPPPGGRSAGHLRRARAGRHVGPPGRGATHRLPCRRSPPSGDGCAPRGGLAEIERRQASGPASPARLIGLLAEAAERTARSGLRAGRCARRDAGVRQQRRVIAGGRAWHLERPTTRRSARRRDGPAASGSPRAGEKDIRSRSIRPRRRRVTCAGYRALTGTRRAAAGRSGRARRPAALVHG